MAFITAEKPKDGFKGWGKVGGSLRLIHPLSDESAAIYVVEEPPGRRTLKYPTLRGPQVTLWLPWVYFFVKASRDGRVSSDAGMYFLMSFDWCETLEEPTLVVPYLPNLMPHGGVCMHHSTEYKASTPVNAVWMAIDWFWESQFGMYFGCQRRPGCFSDTPCALLEWGEMTPPELRLVDWDIPRYRSVKECVQNLLFKYYYWWGRNNDYAPKEDVMMVSDITGEPYELSFPHPQPK